MTEAWVTKTCSVYTMQHSPATRRDEILPFAMMWMDLENITLSGTSQSEKAHSDVGYKAEIREHR